MVTIYIDYSDTKNNPNAKWRHFMKKIVLTGGGTAGHVTPNLALLPSLKERGYEILYIGSYNGIERKLIENAGIEYSGISSGKLRRYFDLKNFSDPFRVLKGCAEARRLIKKYRPDVVFSKGGFVSVPVVLAAKHYKIPTIIHESDMTPGLANKICIPSAAKVCCNFPETLAYLPNDKAVLTGSPIRKELLEGDRITGLNYSGLSASRPIILVIGGSLGSVAVNRAVRAVLPKILETYQVIHICGKGNLDEHLIGRNGYVQYEYVDAPLRHLFAAADLIISRAGANSICEILALKKPNILIPLSASASRGDQILNARSFEKQGFSKVLEEEHLTDDNLLNTIQDTYHNRQKYIASMEQSTLNDAVSVVMDLISSYGET
jgi:UDP-N-acetylglucosamine--N-acetylmuramyl-(pentapeptide) pyrophosphoryl-undecaprenol N-acetylglucosamine transferase